MIKIVHGATDSICFEFLKIVEILLGCNDDLLEIKLLIISLVDETSKQETNILS